MRYSGRSQLNKMAKIIRERKAVPIGEMCIIMNLAPSTIYQYARAMQNLYTDISFKDGVFSVVPSRLEALSAQRSLLD